MFTIKTENILLVGYLLTATLWPAYAETVCSEERHNSNLHLCLEEIIKAAQDKGKFWFGSGYMSRCPHPEAALECHNPLPEAQDSLVSRIFGDSGIFDPALIDRFLDVHYTSQRGQYNSCGYIWDSPGDKSFSLDPLDTVTYESWETRHLPNVSWVATSSEEHYTLAVIDVGQLMNHGIYINIPGNSFLDGEAVKTYHGAEHIFSYPDIYTFLLFKQNGSISLSEEWKTKLNHNDMHGIYTLPEFVNAYGLQGPIALNWVRVTGDPYAIQLHIDHGEYYACPYLMEQEINKHNRSFIPHGTRMTVDVEVTFSPSAIAFTSCCTAFYYDSKTVKLNPLGNSSVRCGDVRTGVNPKVVLTRLALLKDAKSFNNTLYTLLSVDPDVPTPSFGTPDLPLLHWQVSNIRDGDVSTGQVVMTYAGPAPLNNLGHTYYFLLYEQEQELNVTDFINYTNPTGTRSLFNITGFAEEKHLTLVGVTYMVAKSDEYARYDYVQLRGRDPEDYCMGIEGFADPCPKSDATVSAKVNALVLFVVFGMIRASLAI